jgi:hypothetical protein
LRNLDDGPVKFMRPASQNRPKSMPGRKAFALEIRKAGSANCSEANFVFDCLIYRKFLENIFCT